LANEERKKIWPESKAMDPDILLSIGTAFDSSQLPPETPPNVNWGIPSFIRKLLNLMVTIVENNMNSQRTWLNFLAKMAIEEGDSDKNRKFVRLNPDVGERNVMGGNCALPYFDEVDKMDTLVKHTNKVYIPRNSNQLQEVADTLVASLFYFEADRAVREANGNWRVEGLPGKRLGVLITSDTHSIGFILCRLPSNSPGRKKLASRLYEWQSGAKSAFLLLLQGNFVSLSKPSHLDVYRLSSDKMAESDPFQLDVSFFVPQRGAVIKIYLSLAGGNVLISGFPRVLDELLLQPPGKTNLVD
jgi:hypothetical protein